MNINKDNIITRKKEKRSITINNKITIKITRNRNGNITLHKRTRKQHETIKRKWENDNNKITRKEHQKKENQSEHKKNRTIKLHETRNENMNMNINKNIIIN